LILDGNRLYLHRHWQEEQIIVDALNARMIKTSYDTTWLKQRLDDLFDTTSNENREMNLGQKIAAAMTITRQLAIITGGPGTGKTTTVTKILALLLEDETELRIVLAAPTGKAAARLAESIDEQTEKLKGKINDAILENLPRKASTVHRLLGWQRHGGFKHNSDNTLPCDCLLIDETSMIDQGLMASLLQALPQHCRLIMLGDRDQLESVEAGSVLGDITGHGRELSLSPQRADELGEIINDELSTLVTDDSPAIADHIAHLSYSHRFAKGGGIGRLATAVNAGDREAAQAILAENDPELSLLEISEDTTRPGTKIIDWAIERYSPIFNATDEENALNIFEQTRVLTALRQGPWGETAIGEQIETLLRNKAGISGKTGEPFKGMPIIIRKNDPETGLFNGDTGIFWPDAKNEDKLMAWFRIDGKLKPFSEHQLPHKQTAWTLTVHRSQGSQYEQLLLVLPSKETKVLSRELIYTGITRAKTHCTLVVNTAQFEDALESKISRTSGLGERMGWPEE
ncbi:MAG: exodeoxyribonuclease V subunit alpha, partial [Gammaproteobacteria bacterium]|nr:exodeoxyribonuclease V subunit alpha [Gammaproteobacteria bacterium]